ncbi:MAG: hypothetical protein GOMPHAMPRED_004720 [Gomphillus americanus]|uniref:Uncharacterized protein n=1 Tax=Gomphillus americanus TaxID=1940652 RepID=A0A8H3EIY8_9LECA|nr:MAG: hypothetical protein GOMPHAMPRED_004720 [Gomphillus americanus]
MAQLMTIPQHPQALPMQTQVAGNPMHQPQSGHPPMPPPPSWPHAIEQLPPKYVGFLLRPINLPDGQPSWEHIRTERMPESEAKLAELVKMDPNKNKPEEAFKNKHLGDAKKQHIQRILEQHVVSERSFNMTWKLASIKLTQEKLVTRKAKSVTSKVVTISIRIILKRVPRTVPARPTVTGMSPGQHGSPVPPFEASRLPPAMTPIIHQTPGHQGNHGALFGEQTHPSTPRPSQEPLPPGMTMLSPGVEVVDNDDSDDDSEPKQHKTHKKNEKKYKDKKKSKPIDIYIPNVSSHQRHNSKNSSRPTSWEGSDSFSVIDSPMTSVSGSPGWQELKPPPKHYKKYHGGRGGETPRRNGKPSLGVHDNDSFEVIPHQSHKHKNSMDESKYRRVAEIHDDRALAGTLERLELDMKIQDRQKLERDLNVMDRLGKIETFLQHGSREAGQRAILHHGAREIAPREQRAPYDRSYSDTYEIGYSGNRRRNRTAYL